MATRTWTKYPYFEEETSADVVIARMGTDIDPRLRQVMTAAITHLHAFVKEVRPNHKEWLAAIQFLTRTGHMSTDWRQEYILLSDTLGVTMLVDAINNSHGDGATENTILGPFYVENPPHYPNGTNICLDGKGEPLVVRGRVLDTDGNPIAGATIDAWQTNEDGFYDVQQKGVQPEMNLRGIFTTDADGRYWFRTVKPRFYPIPDDGPVGQLLAAMGRGPNRAAHIHFKVKAPGLEEVITHVFPPDCPYLETDAVFGVKETLIGDFRHVDDAAEAARLGFTNPYWALDWDFTLARAK
ncbi:intradiol ring-cleavage dioxygenase [Tabrizicola sp.]|uniref:intradiol ring-cleavage dioxygenase n=1 Tax=Tabrizicola sp. TaxID=2005166 RepID=UPI003F371FF7